MAIVTRTIPPLDIVPGAKRVSPQQNMPDRTRGVKVQLTTESPNSWGEVTGQGSIVRWGIEAREAPNPFVEWVIVENIPFGETGRSGQLPSILLDNAQALANILGGQTRLFIETQGTTVRLGAVITATNVVGEIT